MNKRALVYARVSYDDRKNGARNLEGQVEDGRGHCAGRGHRIVAELKEDDRGASGADWDLPMLNQALDMARGGEFDVLVVRELDRFARGLAKQLVIEGEFKRYGVEVEYILGEYPDTPEGNLMKNVRAVVAEYETLKTRERVARGLRRVCTDGKVMLHGNKPPYGYRVEDKMLVIYEPEARIVRLFFTWYVYGDENGKRLSIKAIARQLTEMKVPTYTDLRSNATFKKKRGYGEWDKSTISQMLRSEVYRGTWRYGRVNSHTGEANPQEHWIEVSVPAIISEEVWQRAQERLEENKRLLKRKPKYEYLIGRRVSCGHCGIPMMGTITGGKYLYYFCPAKRGDRVAKDCDNRYFRVGQVDAAVWEWIKELLLNPEALRRNLEEQQAEQEEASRPLHDRLAVTDDLLADNQIKLEKLLDLYLSGSFDKEILTERKARLETTIAALEKERGDLEATLEAMTLSDNQIMTIEDFAREVTGGLAEAEESFKARRQIIDLLDVRVTLAVEDRQKVAYVRCLVDEAELPVTSTTRYSSSFYAQILPFALTARIVLDKA